MCHYVQEFYKENEYGINFVKEEVTIEDSHDLKIVIKKELECDQFCDAFKAECYSHESPEHNEMCVKTFKEQLTSHNSVISIKCEPRDKTFESVQDQVSGDSLFIHPDQLEAHKFKHSDERNFHCDICDKRFKTKSHLNGHMKYAHATEKLFQCQTCPKSFSVARFLKQHVFLSHNEERPFDCDQCPKKYKTQSGLANHKAKEHGSGSKFSCVECEKQFRNQCQLKNHMLKHSDERNVQCDICHKRFKCKGSLSYHVKTVHTTEKLHQCKVCLKSFVTATLLNRHGSTHSEEKPFKCDRCPKTFKTQCGLAFHVDLHHVTGGKFSCEVCGKMYMTTFLLKRHMVQHSDELNYQCEICNKLFKTKETLLCHNKYAHATDRPFQCDECSKSFPTAGFLKRHMSYHTQEKLFKCYVCSKIYKNKCHMDRHIRKDHKVKRLETVDDVKVEPSMVYDQEMKRSVSDMCLDIKEEIEGEVIMNVDIKEEQEIEN